MEHLQRVFTKLKEKTMEWQLLDEDGEQIANWSYNPTISQILVTATSNGLCIGTLINKAGETILINLEIR